MRQNKYTLPGLLFCLALTGVLRSESETSKTDQTPRILRDLRDSSSLKVLIAAHRGGYESDKVDETPENSLANIQNSERKRYELYETDIQRTRDGHFVIMHDPTIDRETSGVGKVSEMTLDELRGLGKRYRDGTLSQERVATLEEFLIHGKGHTLFKADMKPGVSKHFGEIMELVAKHDAISEIIFRVPYREADLLDQYRTSGGPFAKHTLMFMVTSQKQVADIRDRFDSATIEIKLDKSDPANEKKLELIRYAHNKRFIVETHAEGSNDDWSKLIDAGVRIFHARAPSKVRKFLDTLPVSE